LAGAVSSVHGAEPGVKALFGDGGTTGLPEVLRADQLLEDDFLPQRELIGASLEGEWRYTDLPSPPREASTAAVDAARRSTTLRMRVDMAALGRMRIVFQARAMPIESDAEVRARADRYGHVLLWPNGSAYRVLPPGAVRTLLAEGRADATPLVRAESATVSDGGRRASRRTKKWELATRTGKLVLEQARMIAAGEGGPLFCRFLSEFIAVDPSVAPCAVDDVPVRAQYTWPGGGSIVFEASSVVERTELAATQLSVPPAGVDFARTGVPARGTVVLLTREELGALRARPEPAPIPSFDEGLFLQNRSDVLRYVFLDGIPAAIIAPNHDVSLMGLSRGRYLVQMRTFLGDAVDAPTWMDVPTRPAPAPSESTRDR
jgi:hypothetical protein